MLHATCSNSGRSYGANRVHSGRNYCGASCKQKAYRARKAHLAKVKQGTFSEHSQNSVHNLKVRYGEGLAYMFNQMYFQHGGKALELAIEIADLIDWDDPDERNSSYDK